MMKPALDDQSKRVLPALVVAATFLAYAGTLAFGFVYDDQGQIVRNLFIQSWQYVPRYFTSHVWSYLFPGNVANYYRPLFLLWLRVNHACFGLEPSGWHLTSVLAHLAVTLEVYLLGLRLLEDRGSAAVAAAIFGLHPIHAEAVAWVSGVTDPLAAAFMLGSYLAYLRTRATERQKAGWWAASLVAYALAMLSKETALVFPALVFVHGWISGQPQESGKRESGSFNRRSPFRRFRDGMLPAAPYLALAAAYLPLRMHALGGFSHSLTPVPFTTSVFTWPSLLWFYARKVVYPVGLSPFYDLPYLIRPSLRNFYLPAAGLAVMVGAISIWMRRGANARTNPERWRELRTVGLGLAWLSLPLVPLFDLSVLGSGDIAHDRYLYIPSVGAALIAAAAWSRLAAGGRVWRRHLVVGLAVVVAAALGGATLRATSYWSDNLSLYTRGVNVAPNNLRARLDLANAACDRGLFDAGLKLYAQVIERAPDFPLAFYDLGVTEFELGRLEEADGHLTRAIELNGSDPGAYYSLGLVRFGEARFEESAGLLRRALEIQPEAIGYHLALGKALEASGDRQSALEEYRAEFARHPQSVEARNRILRIESTLPSSGGSKRESGHAKR